MRVILQENIENLGHIGDVVNVSDGYARNFLLPRNLVVLADENNVRSIEHHKKALARKKKKVTLSAQEIAKQLEGFSCNIARKVGANEKIYGSVTTGDIATALKQGGFDVSRKQISLSTPIRQLGVSTISVKLLPEVVAQVKVWVVQEE